MREAGALCSALLRVIHPYQYRAAREALLLASQAPSVHRALETWPTLFSSVHILSNRETPYHRDVAGQASMLELLWTLGTYGESTLVARNLGLQMAYQPGTVVALSSFLVHHGVAAVPPDRICYAWFIAEALVRNHGVDDVPWMERAVYESV